MTRRAALSLRARLIFGAGMIATVAVIGALLSVYGAREISRRIDTAVMAQQQMELLSVLSSRVNDYGMVAAEVTRIGSRTPEERLSILQSRSDVVITVFERLDSAIGASVNSAASQGDVEQNRRATKGLGIARMRAQFDQLKRTLTQHDGVDPSRLRTALDGFATQFSPLLDQAIAQERRDRDAAFRSANDFQRSLSWIAGAVVATAFLALAIFQFGLVRPLIQRIGKITQTAQEIGGGALDQRIEIERRDELGLLFANVNRMAARLSRQRGAVDADREKLNEIIEERTEALTTANAQLEEVDASRRRFFADVSHELRTPLTVILAEADLGLRTSSLPETQARESMALIHTRARRLNRRIDDLLRVARSETGEIDIARHPFDLRTTADDAVSDLAPVAKRRNISVTIDGDDPVQASGDQDWTRQIISGLLDNALRHSNDGSAITISIHSEDLWARLDVEDQGNGIDPTEQSSIFDRFRRGLHATKRSGFGVGLSLAKWVIERQGGEVALESPVNKGLGTRVILRLPRGDGEDANGEQARLDRGGRS